MANPGSRVGETRCYTDDGRGFMRTGSAPGLGDQDSNLASGCLGGVDSGVHHSPGPCLRILVRHS